MPDENEHPPLAGRYWASAAVVLLALCPNIILSTAFAFIESPIRAALHRSQTWMQVVESLSNAGYAFGAVLAAFLVQRFPQRRLFLITEAGFVLASGLCAGAWGGLPFAAGRIIQGFATGLMLVIALPPLTTQYPLPKLPVTAAVFNIGLFGAVTVGPLLGGASASQPGWRWLFSAMAGLGALGILMAALSIKRLPPFNPDARPNYSAFILAALGTALPFFGAAQLESNGFGAPIVWAPLAAGLVALCALIIEQFRRQQPLIPIKALATTLPVSGTLVAMSVGAAFVALMELTATWMMHLERHGPLTAGMTYWPLLPGIIAATIVYRMVFVSRWVPVLVFSGLMAMIAGGAVMSAMGSTVALMTGAALIGYGAGASVGPGLMMAALAVKTRYIGRAFAVVELLRSEATFIIGPIFMHVARRDVGAMDTGLYIMTWASAGIVVICTVMVVAIYFGTGTQMHHPDYKGWLEGGEQALHSPALVSGGGAGM